MIKPSGGRPARRFLIGPGLIIALALSFYVAHQRGLFRKPAPPVVEHAAPSGPTEPPAADIEFLLKRSDELALTREQSRQLRDLQEEWERQTADQRAAADSAAREFDEFMTQATRSRQPAPLEEIQRRAAAVSELSAALARARRTYWQRALLVLDPDQREAVEKALREDLGLPSRMPSREAA